MILPIHNYDAIPTSYDVILVVIKNSNNAKGKPTYYNITFRNFNIITKI